MSVDPSDDCTFWYTHEDYGIATGFDFQRDGSAEPREHRRPNVQHEGFEPAIPRVIA
jgi:hypothetical protein